MSETLRERQLRDLVERIESEAATASRAGQHTSLNRIADDLREVIEGLAATEAPTPCGICGQRHAAGTAHPGPGQRVRLRDAEEDANRANERRIEVQANYKAFRDAVQQAVDENTGGELSVTIQAALAEAKL